MAAMKSTAMIMAMSEVISYSSADSGFAMMTKRNPTITIRKIIEIMLRAIQTAIVIAERVKALEKEKENRLKFRHRDLLSTYS